jgi:serine phosphatase RsbU (regulator of sigma subunit)
METEYTIQPSSSIASVAAGVNRPHDTHRLACLEVWGGNRSITTTISGAGLSGWLWSQSADGEHGGDVYLASLCYAGVISRFFVADVVGHGAVASEWGVRLAELIRSRMDMPDQLRLVKILNRGVFKMSDLGRFATAVLATYVQPTRSLLLCNAGHPRPLYYCNARDNWIYLPGAIEYLYQDGGNLPLGVVPDASYQQYQVSLGDRDLIVLYTDGLPECRNLNNVMLGEDGLLALARGLSTDEPGEFISRLRAAIARWRGGGPFGDDMTILLLTPTG